MNLPHWTNLVFAHWCYTFGFCMFLLYLWIAFVVFGLRFRIWFGKGDRLATCLSCIVFSLRVLVWRSNLRGCVSSRFRGDCPVAFPQAAEKPGPAIHPRRGSPWRWGFLFKVEKDELASASSLVFGSPHTGTMVFMARQWTRITDLRGSQWSRPVT